MPSSLDWIQPFRFSLNSSRPLPQHKAGLQSHTCCQSKRKICSESCPNNVPVPRQQHMPALICNGLYAQCSHEQSWLHGVLLGFATGVLQKHRQKPPTFANRAAMQFVCMQLQDIATTGLTRTHRDKVLASRLLCTLHEKESENLAHPKRLAKRHAADFQEKKSKKLRFSLICHP